MPAAPQGFMASHFAAPPPHERIFTIFKAAARECPEWSAIAVATLVADKLGTSVQHVVESCALVHSLNAARGKFEDNEK